jgi:hypothetical protein
VSGRGSSRPPPDKPKGFKRALGYTAPGASLFRAVPVRTATATPTTERPPDSRAATTWPTPPTATTPLHTAAQHAARTPLVSYKTRGVTPQEALTDVQRANQLMDLDADTVTAGTFSAKASCVATWTKLHHRWFGPELAVLPLTEPKMRAVAAQMKAAGYRSYPNYVSAIKDVHLKASNEWSDALQRCHERCVASTQRGIGPPKQCLELSPIAVARLQLGPEPLVEDGPICPAQWAVICAFHILRGAESACALAAALTVDSVGQRETLFLPVSKTDPQATGCHRSWGCICADKLDEHAACPYHAAVQFN